VSTTKDVDITELHDRFLSLLPANACILDLGCGSGRDSKAFLDRGYRVRSVDGSPEMCRSASTLTGQRVLCMMFNELAVESEFEGVWACASLLHVPKNQLTSILWKVARALKPGGIFYVSFKYGDYEGIRNERHNTDMTEESFRHHISSVKDFEILDMWTGERLARIGREEMMWLNVLVKKKFGTK
jgi:SAM-dependent methyltransferase